MRSLSSMVYQGNARGQPPPLSRTYRRIEVGSGTSPSEGGEYPAADERGTRDGGARAHSKVDLVHTRPPRGLSSKTSGLIFKTRVPIAAADRPCRARDGGGRRPGRGPGAGRVRGPLRRRVGSGSGGRRGVGRSDGARVRSNKWLRVGASDGSCVRFHLVGIGVGRGVGACVGCGVGRGVGRCVGSGVGSGDGSGVGARRRARRRLGVGTAPGRASAAPSGAGPSSGAATARSSATRSASASGAASGPSASGAASARA